VDRPTEAGFLLDQCHERAAKPLVRTPDALIGFAPHDSMFAVRG
jgi:hypothetical protein